MKRTNERTVEPQKAKLYLVEREIHGYEGPYEYVLPYEALSRWEREKLGLDPPRPRRYE